MRTRMLAASVLLALAGCGAATPTPGFQAVPDEPATATEAAAAAATTLPNRHVIDSTVRNPFEPFEQP